MKDIKILLIIILSFFQLGFIIHGVHGCKDAANYAKTIIEEVNMIIEENNFENTEIKTFEAIIKKFKSTKYYSNKCNCSHAYQLAKDGEEYVKSMISLKFFKPTTDHLNNIVAISQGIVSYSTNCENN